MNYKSIFAFLFMLILLPSCMQSNEELIDKAIQYSRQKKYNKAIDLYTEVIKRNNKLQVAWFDRGYAYLQIKKYKEALADLNQVMALHSYNGAVFEPNPNTPGSDEETRAIVPFNEALYERAQVKYFMDSLKSSFQDFQLLVDANYSEKSNCLLWLGNIWIRSGKPENACICFQQAKQWAKSDADREEADNRIAVNCSLKKNSQ